MANRTYLDAEARRASIIIAGFTVARRDGWPAVTTTTTAAACSPPASVNTVRHYFGSSKNLRTELLRAARFRGLTDLIAAADEAGL